MITGNESVNAFIETFPQDPRTRVNPGLTKREYFAAMAMQGILSAHSPITDVGADNFLSDERVAQGAVNYADALIAELNKEKK